MDTIDYKIPFNGTAQTTTKLNLYSEVEKQTIPRFTQPDIYVRVKERGALALQVNLNSNFGNSVCTLARSTADSL